jgi:hypothetical protein
MEKPWSQLSGNHSPLTTILLDDSPVKVRLQPYNHVCVREYNQEVRMRDLRTHVIKSTASLKSSGEKEKSDASVEDEVTAHEDADEEDTSHEQNVKSTGPALDREERRKLKKFRKKALKAAGLTNDGSVDATHSHHNNVDAKYDETLLAVIGILDTMRLQTNVAAWIRAGGLWGKKGPPDASALDVEQTSSESIPRAPSPTDAEVEDINVDDGTTIPPSSSLPPMASSPPTSPPVSSDVTPASQAVEAGVTPSTTQISPTLGKRQLSGPPSEHTSSASDFKRARNGSARHDSDDGTHDGEPLATFTEIRQMLGLGDMEDGGAVSADQSQPKLWFEDEEVFDQWVAEGRRVLHSLNIVEDPGITDE